MRRRFAFRSHSLARLLLCIILLAQSSSLSAAPASRPTRSVGALPSLVASAEPAAPSTTHGPAASCAPKLCSSYLPWIVAGTPSTLHLDPVQPTPTLPAEPTPTPPAQPTPTPPVAPASDVEPPTAPAHLRATDTTSTGAALAWDAATDNVAVAEYALSSGATVVLTTTALSANVSGLTPSTVYSFSVAALDAAGNRSPESVTLVLTTSAPDSPAADAYEPDDSAAQASPIAHDQVQHHALSVASDQDWVAFSALAGQTYQVETFNLAPGVDTYLELYDRDGTTLLAEDDDSSGAHGSWTQQAIAASGTYYVRVRPADGASGAPGYSYDLRLTLVDTEPPSVPGNLRALSTTNTAIELGWDAAADNVGIRHYVVYQDSTWLGSTLATTYTLTGLSAATTYSFRVEAVDSGWNSSDLSAALQVTTALPPDPVAIAPAVDQTVASEIAHDTAFLYSGSNPVQTGVEPNIIQPTQVAIVRGRAITRDGAPIAGVQISVHSHSEYGRTASRADGAFDLAVNGGGPLTIDYQKDGYLPAQRQVTAPWRDYTSMPDVALVSLDPSVSEITLDGASPLQAAAGSVVSDTGGVRQALLIFPANLTALLELPSGAEQPLTTLHVRATEYTVGERGPAAMPGSLPIASAYTYAVDYSVDEAQTAGAQHVRFSQPVVGYVENFLHFPVGEAVPAGYYDRERAVWVASDNGRIVKIVGVTDGLADLDVDGGGQASDPSLLGISDAERRELAGRYQVGQELWRVPVPHFSAWDFN